MAISKHYLNNENIQEPRNWQDVKVLVDWSKGNYDIGIDIDKLEFVGATAEKILARMNGGLTGGVGYFEGYPYRIEVGNPATVFNCYLDFTDNPITKSCNIVEVSLKKKQGQDWIKEVAESFSYRYLASPSYNGNGKITSADYSGVPYVINYIPDGMQLLILAISAFSLTKELIESIKSISTQTTELIKGVTPVVGTGVGFGVVAVTAWSLGQIIGAIINLAITVAYTIGIVYALIKLTEQIIEQLIPKKRYHLGTPLRTLFQKSCDYLGLSLSSTLLDNLDKSGAKWVVLPTKGNKGGEPPTGADPATWVEVGYPTIEDGIDNFGDLIRNFSLMFNADYKIKDGVFQFERKDFWQGQSGYVIPNTFTNQTDLRNETTVNTTEIKANYVIKWNTDQQDLNTLDNQQGRVFQAVTSPVVVNDPTLVNLKGLADVSLNFALPVRKDALTVIEEVLKVFLDAADFLTGQLGKPQGFAGLISSRLGTMHLSSHFISTPKIVVMSGDLLALNQRDVLSANNLWNNYHFLESFVTIDNQNAQRVIYSDVKIPFCFENFVTLSDNNFVQIESGEDAEIISLEWEVEKDVALVSYKVQRVYDNNLKINILTS